MNSPKRTTCQRFKQLLEIAVRKGSPKAQHVQYAQSPENLGFGDSEYLDEWSARQAQALEFGSAPASSLEAD
jgi:hypothetical protein